MRWRLLVGAAAALCSAPVTAEDPRWSDPFYQYRLAVEVQADATGWTFVPITAEQVTETINALEEFHFDPLWFAFNQVRIERVTPNVGDDKLLVTAGFYLVPDSEELFTEPVTGQDQQESIPTEAGAYSLVRYRSPGGNRSPVFHHWLYPDWDSLIPDREQAKRFDLPASYEPALLPRGRDGHECLLRSDGQPLLIRVKDEYVEQVTDVSVKKVKFAFLADIDRPGPQQWMLYYQPMCGQHLMTPQLRRDNVPSQTARARWTGPAEKFTGRTRYRIGGDARADLWFAETTVKLTPQTPVPDVSDDTIRIRCARNEAQSLQIVMRPKRPLEFKRVEISDLVDGPRSVAAHRVFISAVDYVPIRKRSIITPATYLGRVADALVKVERKGLRPQEGNHVLWITVRIPPKTAPGQYRGTLTVHTDGLRPYEIPVELQVYDFQLPEYSTLQSLFGGQYLAKPCVATKDGTGLSVMDFHGLRTRDDLQKLARLYYERMSIDKFYPKSVVLYTEIGMNWSPPPQGYNIDAPDNFFELRDWDFAEFNRDLKHYIDDLKVNSVCLTHTDPTACNTFKHLPGKPRSTLKHSTQNVTMAWQTFREVTYVGWEMKEKYDYDGKAIEITKDQFERLILDFYRALAENLDRHGWLERFFILFDETTHLEHTLHFMRLLKSDPLTARIKIIACMQGLEYFHHKENPGDEDYAFKGLMTYMPMLDENYNRWDTHYFSDYGIERDRDRVWNYAVGTARLAIDTPGINNRITGFDLFRRGVGGYVIWDTIAWEHPYDDSKNPWEDPHTDPWGNGALCFFYPPRKDGPAREPNWTVTPSLRVETYRESVDDYEYARILEDLIAECETADVDVSEARRVLTDLNRFFYSPVHWSQNDAWFLDLRDRMAAVIVDLQDRLNQ